MKAQRKKEGKLGSIICLPEKQMALKHLQMVNKCVGWVSAPQCLTMNQARGMVLNEYVLNESMNE